MSDTSNLESLLRRWAELEPERCAMRGPQPSISVMRAGIWRVAVDEFGEEFHRVQPAVQEAIEARGWSWGLSGIPKIKPKASASVWRDKLPGAHHDSSGSTPTEALLSAYIKAIES